MSQAETAGTPKVADGPAQESEKKKQDEATDGQEQPRQGGHGKRAGI